MSKALCHAAKENLANVRGNYQVAAVKMSWHETTLKRAQDIVGVQINWRLEPRNGLGRVQQTLLP